LIPLAPITLHTSEKSNVKLLAMLELKSMTGREGLGRPFEYELELVSSDPHLDLAELLGKPVTLRIELGPFRHRFWNGIATDVGFVGSHGRHALYRVMLQPKLSLLERTSNCRIFQKKTVPAIVKEVFAQHGFSAAESLQPTYAEREFVVQYEETDFDFVSRLLEEEGIYYFFAHQEDDHEIVLADSIGAHGRAPGYETIPYYPPDMHRAVEIESIDRWELRHRLIPAGYVSKDFDFERPRVRPEFAKPRDEDHALKGSELFDYAGAYLYTLQQENDYDKNHKETQRAAFVKVRLEEIHAGYEQIQGTSNARGIAAGNLFKLREFPRPEQNRDYLVVSVDFELHAHNLSSGKLHAEEPFRCSFTVLDAKRPFRPKRLTPKPRIRGPQTARVVGPEKSEIWTDEYGRVQLLFPWDRYGVEGPNCSCFVRVAQAWAGNGWGSMHIPRVGQEVIVEFLEGDPDRPVVTGRLYNKDNPVPYALTAHQTQSGIKSRSTPGGGPNNFNEIRFEDKKGHEELYLQAEKNQTTLVKATQSITVGADRALSVEGNDATTVKKDRTVTVTGNEVVTIEKVRRIDVTGDVEEEYGARHSLIVTDAQIIQSDNTTLTAPNGIELIQSPGTGAKLKDDAVGIKAVSTFVIECGTTKIAGTPQSLEIETSANVIIKCGTSTTIALSAGSVEISSTSAKLSCAGSTIDVGATGVSVKAAMIKLNS
jgi:type VI secretion system secreted protein VgrG